MIFSVAIRIWFLFILAVVSIGIHIHVPLVECLFMFVIGIMVNLFTELINIGTTIKNGIVKFIYMR